MPLHEEEILYILEALYGPSSIPPVWDLKTIFEDAAIVSIEWADSTGTHRAKLLRPQLPNEPWLPISR